MGPNWLQLKIHRAITRYCVISASISFQPLQPICLTSTMSIAVYHRQFHRRDRDSAVSSSLRSTDLHVICSRWYFEAGAIDSWIIERSLEAILIFQIRFDKIFHEPSSRTFEIFSSGGTKRRRMFEIRESSCKYRDSSITRNCFPSRLEFVRSLRKKNTRHSKGILHTVLELQFLSEFRQTSFFRRLWQREEFSRGF